MEKGYTEKIRERIESAEDGTIFIACDFADIANTAAVKQILKRLTDSGLLHRILNGVYQKPKFSRMSNEYTAADPEEVAKALARNFHWTIAPSGERALNLLGLSPQAPEKWVFISNGPSRSYRWENGEIEFVHRTNKEITGLSYVSALVVQALKTLGKANVTPEVIGKLSHSLSKADKEALLKEAAECTDWIYDTIRRIAGEGTTL